jgi:hypothetical protein
MSTLLTTTVQTTTVKANTLLHSDGSTTNPPAIPALDKRMAAAWVQFSGTGTVAVNQAYNVSSITDHGTGDYSANFGTALSTAYYAVTGSTIGSGGYYSTFTCGGSASTSAARIKIQHINNNLYDNSAISLIVMAP